MSKKIQDAFDNPELIPTLTKEEKKILDKYKAQGFLGKKEKEQLKKKTELMESNTMKEITKKYPEYIPEETFSEDIIKIFQEFPTTLGQNPQTSSILPKNPIIRSNLLSGI